MLAKMLLALWTNQLLANIANSLSLSIVISSEIIFLFEDRPSVIE